MTGARRWQRMGLAGAAMLMVSARVLAWGPQGHAMTGALADSMLNPHSRAEVSALLGMPLADATRWADCVKDVRLTSDGPVYKPTPRYHAACAPFETREGIGRMEDYVARNTSNCPRAGNAEACHKQYHYTDVDPALGTYRDGAAGTSGQDVVHALGAAIAVLRGQPSPAPFSLRDKQEALLLVAHLAGDIHQPLHVAALYLDANGARVHPDAAAAGALETRGGNAIRVGGSNLHSDWDSIARNLSPERLPARMLDEARAVPVTAGAVEGWPAAWASETIRAAAPAFEGLSFSPRQDDGTWTANFDDRPAYLKQKNAVQYVQLERAGARLAQLLNAIWP